FVLAHLTQLVLAVDALVAKNTIQVVALAILNGLLAVYAGIQIADIRSLVSGYLAILIWCIPAMITLTQLVYLACLWPIWREFGWSVFKAIGADRRVKKSYAWYQVFICVLKFDLFFFIAFSLQLVFLVPTQTDAERWITVAALPVTSGMLLLGFLAVKHENRTGYWCFLASCALGSAYFIYKLFIIYRDRETDYRLVFKSLTVFAALCLAALILTTVTVTVCYRHFGRGLKYHSASRRPVPSLVPSALTPLSSRAHSVSRRPPALRVGPRAQAYHRRRPGEQSRARGRSCDAGSTAVRRRPAAGGDGERNAVRWAEPVPHEHGLSEGPVARGDLRVGVLYSLFSHSARERGSF
ncbi:uncharacterized protein RHOBADRAFT_12732, partial [Rhodotorula graminis WP1]